MKIQKTNLHSAPLLPFTEKKLEKFRGEGVVQKIIKKLKRR